MLLENIRVRSFVRFTNLVVLLAAGFLVPCISNADEVHLKDGSKLVGEVRQMSDNVLVMDTGFASRLEISADKIRGIKTDSKLMVLLDSGDRIAGVLDYSETAGQRLAQTVFGEIDLGGQSAITGIWKKGESNPELIAGNREQEKNIAELEEKHRTEVRKLEKSHEAELEEVQKEMAELEEPWSGSIGLGISGQSGNTETFSVQGRGEARRETEFDRLMLYVEGNLEEQNSVTSTNEVFAGASLEHDLTSRWFVFGSADFEKDEFEDLELRGIAQAGGGYFFIREPNLHFKGLAGLGFQHESFTDGTTVEEGIITLGYDFLYDYNDWWQAGHKLTYFPSLTSPLSDYRLVSNAFTEVPLVRDEPWKVRLSVRNQYDNEPKPGIEKLDTSYLLNLVYNWE